MAASESGRSVILLDEQAELGGGLLHDIRSTVDGVAVDEWLKRTLTLLRSRNNVVLLARATAFGYYNHNHIAIVERVTDHLTNPPDHLPRERLWQVRAGHVVLATGAHERPLVFADNDRPGIMLAESVRAFINRYAVVPGGRIVFATNGASAYQAAADAIEAGIEVMLIDVRRESACGPEVADLRARNVQVITGHTIVGSTGRKRVTGLIVAPVNAQGVIGARRTLACDCVGMSGGWTPAVHLFSQSRGKLRFDGVIDAFVPGASAQATSSAGACKGTYDLNACLAEGWRLGFEVTGRPVSPAASAEPTTLQGFVPVRVLPTDGDAARVRAFVDFQNDVTAKDIKLAVLEGFESVEHVKRYTTTRSEEHTSELQSPI